LTLKLGEMQIKHIQLQQS